MTDLWLYSYLVSFFGSVSFGYFLIRFGLPDIRTLQQQSKLGLSGFAGIMIFIISGLAAYFFMTPMYVYVLMPSLTFIAIAFITIRNQFFAPKTVKVALPVAKINPTHELPKKEDFGVEETLKEDVPYYKQIRRERKTIEPEPEKERIEVKRETKPGLFASIKKIITPNKEGIFYGQSEKEAKAKKAKLEVKTKKTISKKVEPKKEEKHQLSRRERYLQRRKKMKEDFTEQAKADLTKPKELKGPSEPLPIIPEEEVQLEFGEGLDLSDLETTGSLGELSELEDLDDSSLSELSNLDDSSLENLGGLAESNEITKEKGMSCPFCKAKNASIIYCPYCGKGFCTNCSLKIERKGNLIFYQCPSCKKEVIVKA